MASASDFVTARDIDPAEAERVHLRALSQQSTRDDTVLVELVYQGHWARFDLTAMEAQHLPLETLVERHLAPALAAVGVPRSAGADPSSS